MKILYFLIALLFIGSCKTGSKTALEPETQMEEPPAPTRPAQSKVELQKEIEKFQQENDKNSDVIISSNEPLPDKIKASRDLGVFKDYDDLDKIVAFISDKEIPAEIRAEVMKKASTTLGKEENGVEAVASILVDTSEEKVLREQALATFNLFEFSSPFIQDNPAYYTETLRKVVTDDNTTIRNRAIEILTLKGDDFTQEKLIESLNAPNSKLVDDATAIRHLSNDLHANSFQAIHKKFKESEDVEVRTAAARCLGNFDDAKEDLETAFTNEEEAESLRNVCGTVIQTKDKGRYVELAKSIVTNEKDDLEYRTDCLKNLQKNYGEELKTDESFNQAVKKVKRTTPPPLKDACKEYLKSTN